LPQEPALAFEGDAFQLIQRHVGDLAGKRTCVIGSGDNYAALALAAVGATVTSVDISQRQLDVAADRARTLSLSIDMVRSDAAGLLGIESDAFDLVTSTNGFFVWISQLGAVFDSVHRVLERGGHYIFYDVHPFTRPFNGRGPLMEMGKSYWSTGPHLDDESGTYEYHWTLSDLANSALRSGLELVEIAETGPRSSRFFEDHSYEEGTDDRLLDWRHNPLAAIPSWLTVVARKG
jgi:SAM-dependent methyltransferase